MKLAMVGLGRMGTGMARRLIAHGHEVVGWDPLESVRQAAASHGIAGATSLDAAIASLAPPRLVWIMVPAGDAVDRTLDQILPLLEPGDTVVDGGNSNYHDTLRRAERVRDAGMHMLDCGTSGGVWGLQEGYSLMIGGDDQVVQRLAPVFEALAPAADRGWGRVGPSGAGHFVKMVHNGIEYGLMQAYAEGFSILQHKQALELDPAAVARIWQHGSVVRSWLLDLAADALEKDPGLESLQAWVDDSGEGRWTVAEALDLDVPAPVITQSLIERLRSRERNSFADRMLAALRAQFGGHAVRRKP